MSEEQPTGLTPERVAGFLRDYNAWRRGSEQFAQPDPMVIGEAIDVAISMLEGIDAERGKEAVAWRLLDDEDYEYNTVDRFSCSRSGGEPLYAVPPDAAAMIKQCHQVEAAMCDQISIQAGQISRLGAEIANLRAMLSVPQPAIPEGYALVPVEPTLEMIEAGRASLGALYGQHGAMTAYRAMLAAAKEPK